MFIYYHYSSCSHQSGLEMVNLYFISPPTFLFNATTSATAVTKIMLHYGRWFPTYYISYILGRKPDLGESISTILYWRNIFLDKMDIGISGGKNKNITVGMLLFFFSSFSKITVGGFVNHFI